MHCTNDEIVTQDGVVWPEVAVQARTAGLRNMWCATGEKKLNIRVMSCLSLLLEDHNRICLRKADVVRPKVHQKFSGRIQEIETQAC